MIGDEGTLIFIRNIMTISNTNLNGIQGRKNFKSYEINGLITITVSLIAKIPSKISVEYMTYAYILKLI